LGYTPNLKNLELKINSLNSLKEFERFDKLHGLISSAHAKKYRDFVQALVLGLSKIVSKTFCWA
jgi:hypothetical protein